MGDKRKNISGIYKIINVINKKMYIGSTNNLNNRRDNHFSELKRNTHPNAFLQNSFNKYGNASFMFEIIEFCNIEVFKFKRSFLV